MQLYQFNFSYLPAEDRLLFRMTTVDRKVILMLFTRRMVSFFVPELDKIIETTPIEGSDQTIPQSKEMREELAKFQHESNLAKSDFDTPFDESATKHVIDGPPLLIEAIQLTPIKDDQFIVNFIATNKQSIGLTLNLQLINTLYHLLNQVAEKAEWKIEFKFATKSPQHSRH